MQARRTLSARRRPRAGQATAIVNRQVVLKIPRADIPAPGTATASTDATLFSKLRRSNAFENTRNRPRPSNIYGPRHF